ncbi:MAG: hypothetical protein ABH873_00015 [Candidatus Firestonebacteria bacterium]
MKMKKIFFLMILLFIVVGQVHSENIINAPIKPAGYSGESEGMQLGLLGVSVRGIYSQPIGEIRNVFNPGLGAELVISYRDFLFKDLDIQLVGDYQSYTGKVDNSNKLQSIIVKLLGRYNFYIKYTPGCFYFDFGGGMANQTLNLPSSSVNNIDPVYHLGVGYEVEIIKSLTAQAGVNCVFIPERYISNATRDGSFINISLGINYNFLKGKNGGE